MCAYPSPRSAKNVSRVLKLFYLATVEFSDRQRQTVELGTKKHRSSGDCIMRFTRRLDRAAALPGDHVNLRHSRMSAVTAQKLHQMYLQRKYTSCVWASAAVARNCRLAKHGEAPLAAPLHNGGQIEFYNVDQLLRLARTASGKWFPMPFQRALSNEQFQRKYRSTVWFQEYQLGNGIVPLPRQAPAQLTLDGEAHHVYNTDQLVPPLRTHAFGNGSLVTKFDAYVLEYVAGSRGFTSNVWSAESVVGVRPGVACSAHVLHARFGTSAMYNHGQLDWPLPVPDPPHCWASGVVMLPHEQAVLEQARVTLGLTSRRWVGAHAHVAGNNVLPGMEPTHVEFAMPRRTARLVNTDQLIDRPPIASQPRVKLGHVVGAGLSPLGEVRPDVYCGNLLPAR
jgi:hypothetical protein